VAGRACEDRGLRGPETMFQLHPTLAADTIALARWPLSEVRLMRDASYPWLILVPARPGLRDLHDVAAGERVLLIEEIARASDALVAAVAPDKINVAALGNVVEQLHVHVIARFRADPAWPNPVWGAVPRRDYPPEALARVTAALGAALGGGR